MLCPNLWRQQVGVPIGFPPTIRDTDTDRYHTFDLLEGTQVNAKGLLDNIQAPSESLYRMTELLIKSGGGAMSN